MAEVWHVQNGVERKLGLSDRTLDTFVLASTRPVWLGTNNASNNVGCIYGVPRSTASSITQANGAIHQNLNIPFQLTITQPNQKFINCRFTYSFTGDAGGGIAYVMSSSALNIRFERCEFEPSTPGDRYNGIYGHDFIAYRCAITKTVDGIGIYNSNSQPVNVKVHGCWIGHLAWFRDDTSGGTRTNAGHNDGTGTHNDGIQQGSGTNVEVIGNFWQGAKYNANNPSNLTLDANYMGYTLSNGNGVDTLMDSPPNSGADATRFIGQGQIFLAQHSAYYLVNDITYTHNWLWNFDNGWKALSNSTYLGAGSHRNITNITVTDNIFGGRPRNWGGSQLYYPIRYDSNCTVNGRLIAAGGVADDSDSAGNPCNNKWASDATVAATYGDGDPIAGFPVRHRIDPVAVP